MEFCAIGSDETLKGDTFGGLVVVGAFFEEKENLHFRDSKTLSEQQILAQAGELLEHYKDRFVIKNLSAKEYNDAVSFQKVTGVLNALHLEVGLELKKRFGQEHKHLVDEYPGCHVGDYQVKQAESQNKSVAAASIVARYYAIKQFEELSKDLGFIVPKGSTHVQEALMKIKSMNIEYQNYVKIGFKNVKKALLL
jgi:ribonuclease HIII